MMPSAQDAASFDLNERNQKIAAMIPPARAEVQKKNGASFDAPFFSG
jgi:hypothetical protein